MTSLDHSSAVLWHHSQTAACALSLPPKLRTQCCVLVLSLHKLQIADEEHLTVYRPVSTGTTWSVPAHGNLPFCDSCPSASTTELGYDAAVLYSWGRLVVEWCTNSKLSDDNSHDSTVFFFGEISWILDTSRWDPIGCPGTSVRNYHYTLRSSPEKLNSHSSLFAETAASVSIISERPLYKKDVNQKWYFHDKWYNR
jgi:hypothetical protein